MMPAALALTASRPQLRECPGCGLLQRVGALPPGASALCTQCSTTLRRTSTHRADQLAALALAAFVLLVVMCSSTLMSVQKAGISRAADLFSGPQELVSQGMGEIAVVIVFVTVIAPFARLVAMVYVLARSHEASPPPHLRRIFAWAEKLRPWSMVDVFVFGVFVAYTKLGDLVTIGLSTGVYALLAATFVLVWIDAAHDPEALWETLDRDSSLDSPVYDPARMVGCETCGLVAMRHADGQRCRRCDGQLHARKPNSIARTWALTIAAALLYLPANYYPVLSVVQSGAGSPSTILGGIEELLSDKLYPLAALVFFASILVPLLKLVGLTVMLISTQTGYAGWLRDRTRLYTVIRFIGRWSMIDIFMESLLGALVAFGSVITIQPGVGAIAFCSVVILTMFAAETFDPRLMWDAAAKRRAPLGREFPRER
jgi:paraquat-inducible protein A